MMACFEVRAVKRTVSGCNAEQQLEHHCSVPASFTTACRDVTGERIANVWEAAGLTPSEEEEEDEDNEFYLGKGKQSEGAAFI